MAFGYRPVQPKPSPPPNFVHVPGGSFTMGSPPAEAGRYSNEVQHRVSLTGFEMDKYDVTFEEYDAYCAATGWRSRATTAGAEERDPWSTWTGTTPWPIATGAPGRRAEPGLRDQRAESGLRLGRERVQAAHGGGVGVRGQGRTGRVGPRVGRHVRPEART